MKMPWAKTRELVCNECDGDLEEAYNPEHERLKMLRMWTNLAIFGVLGAFAGAVVLSPDAFPIVISLSMMTGTGGYVCGRFLHKTQDRVESLRLDETHEVLTKIEEDLTTRISRFSSDNSRLRKKIAKLERSLEEEQEVRLDAQRDLVNHMRFCDV